MNLERQFVKMRSYQSRLGPDPMTGVFIGESRNTDTQGKANMGRNTPTGRTLWTGRQRLGKETGGMSRSPSKPSEGPALPTP